MKMTTRSVRENRFRLMAALGAVALLASFSGCSPKPVETGVLVKVGAHAITIEDFQKEVQWRIQNQRPLPDKQALLEELISRELHLQKARAAGLENDPDVRRTYDSILAAKVDERELTPRLDAAKVSPEEIRAAFQENIAHYTRPAKVRLALICLKIDPKMSPDKLAGLESRIAEARTLAKNLPPASRGFGRVAVDFSEDQASRYQGGDVGWFDQGQDEYRWPKEVVATGFTLKNKGDISDVIKTTDGFYLVSKLDSRESVVTPLEQVQVSLQRRLLAGKQQQAQEAYVREMRAFAPVQTYPQALATLEYPTTTVAKAEGTVPPGLPRSP
jgi:peptidyl-prolyl cis-trans isomerase C